MASTIEQVRGIGYEGHTIESFLAVLSDARVECVIDVRLNAISRKKGFSKRALTDALTGAGIEYLHLPGLGNPKDNRDGFWKPDTSLASIAHAEYRRMLKSERARAALSVLLEVAETKSVRLLCFEEREERCHRRLILESLENLESSNGAPRPR
ncbi:DUF488 family protein [Arthrobacter caoxuetaonis]|uniref:DUF488 domain-containing protein n=1 Tax=Arthrobacter caoxuetaonis TaxID=2886935 RepID=A0A9X1ME41_9MICC|nr:DUF488 domain-containing protein [Arthrobacter caoxuetaonis]MCC3282009.1 DUF488 domain-containing protein [Arthrobacter caoxuetaonis]MCC3282952.1 DUF488 domain-containing protein [Arthrobacter caoxuetaonis]MCC3298086.1 DUF488 domain-containing protein [Arthrobacter caoxuetaonis]USQ57096.1 DUF488 domain-containing protein [Arthrobacter caoxuetaonis]